MNDSAGFDFKQVRQGEGTHVLPQSSFGNTTCGGDFFWGNAGCESLCDCWRDGLPTGEESLFECLCPVFCVDFIECNLSHAV
jgi:hypothetical protein